LASRHIELNNEIMVKLNGFYQIEKDKEAVREFEKEVKEKMVTFKSLHDKLRYLIENDFYYDVLADYSIKDIQEVWAIPYSYNFKFQSYMAISKFYKDYAMKTNDKQKYLETYEDRIAIVALYLARGEVWRAKFYATQMIKQNYQPATPTFLNAGKARRGEMVSCFLLEVDDSLNAITFHEGVAQQLSKIGGGVAINLSLLRGERDPIKGIKNVAKGVLPIAKKLEMAFAYADQMGQRKGSGAAYLNIFHIDSPAFLDTKKINADERIRLKTLSIGLIIPSKFMELAERGEDFYTFSPYDVFKKYGIHLDNMDMDIWYDRLVEDEDIRKEQLSARDFMTKIAQTQMESGYPYIMFKDNANKWHSLKDIGMVKMSNLCTEIFQLQETSIINDYGIPDEIKRDINCNLGSLNIVNIMENKEIKEAVFAGMDMLTAVSDMTSIANAPSVKKANDELHSVGLGLMNLHGFFAKNRIYYESKEAIDFVRALGMTVNYYSILRSMTIAKERKQKFKDFEKSAYADGRYFRMYFVEDFSPKTDKIKKLFEGIYIPTIEDWKRLANEVAVHGLYHAYRLAVAPTQSISYIQNATSSVMPVVEIIEERKYGNATTFYPMPFLSPETVFFYKSAYDVNMFKLIDLIAELQRHIDQGISTILYVNSNTSTYDLARYYIYAHKRGLKSLYYTRTRNLSVEECTSCAV